VGGILGLEEGGIGSERLGRGEGVGFVTIVRKG